MLACILGFGLAYGVQLWLGTGFFWLAGLLSLTLAWGCGLVLTRNLARSLAALEIGLLNFKDNDFSVSIPVSGDPQLQGLARLFNEAADKLRKERQYIYQRELLLDKVIQSSPNVMLLLDDRQRVLYANDAARHLFYQGQRVDGLMLDELLSAMPAELVAAVAQGKDGLFVMGEDEPETWHLSRGRFLLNNQRHQLILLKQLTRELNRQEVAVWKKVIRIISHELNNSVAPIASMVNSGKLLTQDLDEPKLRLIFDTIADRTHHLSQFISDYAKFARLPLPKLEAIDWSKLTGQLAQHYPFSLAAPLPEAPGLCDPIQLEQVLLNLLKNAHESGSAPEDISMSIVSGEQGGSKGVSIHVDDRGPGMSAEVLEQALLPFYSTKQAGTGLGLALCREIIEAHEGRIGLSNRQGGGLSVSCWLPMT
ncbi:ATP-binding protein [Shewanella sp. AS16]|uniref:sensor histidine kinase n=1 Tax=Shewanella sp. AS16 TaxID=2907625 RepID=UPI001F1B26FB|nr:ATP-binding protein [Shewanella sp. AS16]MCE9685440.1 ATP-binding protein [Shewanella sp. AS16]